MGMKGLINKLNEKIDSKKEELKIKQEKYEKRYEESKIKQQESKKLLKEEAEKIMASNPVVNDKPKVNNTIKNEKVVCCPKCGSTQLTANKKGFSLGKALVGGIALVPIAGVATGMIGKNKIIITCLNCGKQFKPGK